MKKFLLAIFMIIPFWCFSQPENGGPGDPPDPDDTTVPITGIEILLAAGGLLGAKKIHDNRKRKSK